MNTSKSLRNLSRQKALIAALFDCVGDAQDELKQFDTEPQTEGVLMDLLYDFEADLRELVDRIVEVERQLIAGSKPLVGG